MSREVLQDFDDGHGLTEAQRNTLGIWVPDPDDGYWVYGQYWENGNYKTGHVLRHAAGVDLLSDADGAVSESIPAGATYLVTAGKFGNSLKLKGAIGYIYDGAGEGQTFYIRETIKGDINRVEIGILSSATRRPRAPGWDIALDTTSRFRLWLPGRFYFGDGLATDLTAGVCQTELTVDDGYKPFGWAKCEGGAFALQDDNAANRLTLNSPVLHRAGGLVEGVPADVPAVPGTLADLAAARTEINQNANAINASRAARARMIGRADFAPVDKADNSDTLVSVTLTNIPQRRPSYSREGEGHSRNQANII